ncbi:asparagine synthase (glutamine-hydrolyzing) [Magnetospirillum sp. 15-1]|uniref:asparagine synthase (glutamine-hydrolyzing) n=1 Tax=Magnetospirillum sp. 15-1 TaxID=1979370 RepID=UPI000BBBC90D|nr:asparagine synthase (glutamine-hydrolyzing) [Magnetospirillum sp. 15-1]
MCGITGWLSWGHPPAPEIVAAMNDRIIHRGPNAGAVASLGPVVLGHRRLSVIDLSDAANQPMTDSDGRLTIAFNGEIYNFRELRDRLAVLGHTFRTQSDTEVLLAAYRQWDLDFLEHLNGMFAFALWDAQHRRLVLARDRLGEKPLFYTSDGQGGLVFASEIKALRAHPAVGAQVDPRALGQFLSLNYTLTDSCLLAGVSKLPPAHYMVVEAGTAPRIFRYWDLAAHFRDKGRHTSERRATEELLALLDDSVRLRMVSDVPLGAFLSGGIDSSSIVAAMARHNRADLVHTFSIGFSEASFSEVPKARAMAATLGVSHHDRIVDVDMARDLQRIVHFGDEPMADSSLIPIYYLAAFAREKVTVALSGDGGDEILAGYETYAADRIRHLSGWVPAMFSRTALRMMDRLWRPSLGKVSLDYKLRRFLKGHALPPDQAHYFWRGIFDDDEKAALIAADRSQAVLADNPYDGFAAHADELAGCHYLDRAMYVDIKTWLPEDILVKVDRATMAHALESRAPFLDHRLVEFAASLPVEWKMKGFRKKHLLKESQRGRLPDATLDQRKEGFNAPVSHWLLGGLKELSADITHGAVLGQWVRPEAVDRLWADHHSGRRDNGLRLFGLTCLGLWLEEVRHPATVANTPVPLLNQASPDCRAQPS